MRVFVLIVSVAVMSVMAASAQATVVSVERTTSYLNVSDNNFDGNGDGILSNGYVGIYDYGTGDVRYDKLYRIVTLFELPTLASGEYIDSAVLKLYLTASAASSPDVSLYHLPDTDAAAAVAGDFEATPANILNSSFVTSASATGQYYTQNVLTQIQADYTDSDTYSAFRLQLADETNNDDGVNNRYRFHNNLVSGQVAVLELNVVPEPATIFLLGLGSLTTMIKNRRK